jgi:CubicO group peptidase (beta-lactamase class C family)
MRKGIYFSGRTHAEDTAIAAGQLCPWRHKLLKGAVDDENAYCLGGVAGHAGLFGTAMAVHKVIAALWAVFTGSAANDLFSTDTARLFMTPPPDGRRPLGFDIPTGEKPACGRLFTGPTIGHLGFTGVSFWLDLSTGCHVVLLTNRTHPFRFTAGIKTHRPIIHDTVMRVLRP